MTKADYIKVRALLDEAVDVGDWAQVCTCAQALAGDSFALDACLTVIADAKAQEVCE